MRAAIAGGGAGKLVQRLTGNLGMRPVGAKVGAPKSGFHVFPSEVIKA